MTDTERTPVMLTDQERRVIAAALEINAEIQDALGTAGGETMRWLATRVRPAEERAAMRLAPITRDDLTREQELAADAMASEFGRSSVRWQGDGSVVIVGMTDDVERRTVCVERDGRERWRR